MNIKKTAAKVMNRTNKKRIFTQFRLFFLISPLVTFSQSSVSLDLSDWAFGAGLGVIDYPHYLGSDERSVLVAPFPYVEYYGEHFQLDDDGLAASVFNSDRVNLNISMSTSLPATGEDNRAREGMDELNLVVEAGPVLEISLMNWSHSELRFDVPLRAAFDIELSSLPQYSGLVFDPKLHFETGNDELRFEWQLGGLYGSQKFNDLYYSVDPEFVIADRPEFQAKSGLQGWRSAFGASLKTENWRFFGSLRYYDLRDAENKESPLFRSNNYWSAGIGIVRMFNLPERKTAEN